MIVWGSGGDVINLGTPETRRCDTCERDRPFNVMLQYRYWGLYWIFNFVTEKKYMLLCSICSRGWQLETGKVEQALSSIPIPFMHRYGILVLIGVIAVLVIIGSLA